jgi:DNA-binding LacI/PurR family transcriptional regulator
VTTTRLAAVAKFAGVSQATVSRVLRDKPGISAATRDSVLTALDVLGFERPVQVRSARARLIGLVLPDLQNPIFPAFADVIAAALIKRGLVPVLCTRTADGVSEANYIEMLLAQQAGGIIFVGSSFADAGPEHCRTIKERRLPVVLVNAADVNPGVSRLCADDAVAVEQSLAHLTSLGHERIGLVVGPVGHVPSARKYAAYRGHFERKGGAPHWRKLVAHTMFSTEGGRSAAAKLLEEKVTAVICASDALALGAIKAARKRGLDVPGDLSVVGFDDSTFMAITDPPLTTVRQPIEAIAAGAVSSLLAQLEGRMAVAEELMFEPELIVRGSTGPAVLRT